MLEMRDEHFTGEWGLTEYAQLHFLEASLQNTALFPAHKEKVGGKRASCAYPNPLSLKLSIAHLSHRFFFSVNIKVACSET